MKEFGSTLEAFGLGLLLWGMVDRPAMILVASAVLIASYTAIGCAKVSK